MARNSGNKGGVTRTTKPDAKRGPSRPGNDRTVRRDPKEWKTGDEPMTGAQASYLETLAQGQGEAVDPSLTKAEASEKIDELRNQSGGGSGAGGDGDASVDNTRKDPDAWKTGDEPMTGAQASYLRTLSEEAGVEFEEGLTKAEAAKRIDALQERTGRGK